METFISLILVEYVKRLDGAHGHDMKVFEDDGVLRRCVLCAELGSQSNVVPQSRYTRLFVQTVP